MFPEKGFYSPSEPQSNMSGFSIGVCLIQSYSFWLAVEIFDAFILEAKLVLAFDGKSIVTQNDSQLKARRKRLK